MTKFSGGGTEKSLMETRFCYIWEVEGPAALPRDIGTLYVGEKMFSFTTDHRITKYVYPVGNGDVPYPYAVDKKLTCTIYSRKMFFFLKIDSSGARDDPYSFPSTASDPEAHYEFIKSELGEKKANVGH